MNEELFGLIERYNEGVLEENALNSEQLEKKRLLMKSQLKMNGFSELIEPCKQLINRYKEYDICANINNASLEARLEKMWVELESKCNEWSSADFIAWIRFKLEWVDDNSVPKAVNLDEVQKNLKSRNINGCNQQKLKKQQFKKLLLKCFSVADDNYQMHKTVEKICAFFYELCDEEGLELD